jgi:mono/diheme cytochrome c family protein
MRRTVISMIVAVAWLSGCASPAQGPREVQVDSANYERGQLLYENHCQVCHDSRAHIRSNRKAKSPSQLKQWVTRWSTHLKLDWQKAEIDDVALYLGRRYYKFGPGEN